MKRALMIALVLAVYVSAQEAPHDDKPRGGAMPDDKAAAEAFAAVASVLQHPRCMNCHPAADHPLQGDGARSHSMNVMRGPEGRGTAVMRCTNCHQDANNGLRNAPPGVLDWHMPPAASPMPFQGLTPAALCARLKDPKQNGGRDPKQLDDHLDTALVRWAFQPGPGRTTPPMSYDGFRAKFRAWIDYGCGCPQ